MLADNYGRAKRRRRQPCRRGPLCVPPRIRGLRLVLVLPLLLLMLLLLLLRGAVARLQLARTFGPHMVLQRTPHMAAIYGYADPGSTVVASFIRNGQKVTGSGTADMGGNFALRIPPQRHGGPFEIRVANMQTNETLLLDNVLFGDVWLCSGQDNMQMPVSQALQPDKEGDQATEYPLVRLFTVAPNASARPLDDLGHPLQPWTVSSREAVLDSQGFSAMCYFFGQLLNDCLKVPIGLVASTYSGTPIVAWSDRAAVLECSYPSSGRLAANGSDSASPRRRRQGRQLRTEASSSNDDPSLAGPFSPSVVFNAMIRPLRRMAMRGVVWYQGEDDAWQPDYYACAFPAMIRGWREQFVNSNTDDGPMPFGFVQLPSYDEGVDGPLGATVGQMRLTQYSAFKEPNVFMAATFDLGDADGRARPRDKQDVAWRLALAAEASVYGIHDKATRPPPIVLRASAEQEKHATIQVTLTIGQLADRLSYADLDVGPLFEIVPSQQVVGPTLPPPLPPPSQPAASASSLEGRAMASSSSSGRRLEAASATFATGASIVGNDTVLLTFSLDNAAADAYAAAPALTLRYAARNNVCPPRTVPNMYKPTCGLYNHVAAGFLPLWPLEVTLPVKRV